jgi:hypothetical protein
LSVALRNRLSEHNQLAETDGLRVTMVQAKPGQDSKGRTALRRVRDAAHPRLREGDCDPPPDLPKVLERGNGGTGCVPEQTIQVKPAVRSR